MKIDCKKIISPALLCLVINACSFYKNEHVKNSAPKLLHIQAKDNETIEDFEKDFEWAIKAYKEKNGGNYFDFTKGKDIVVAFGNTGSGKSTLLNLLVGHDLVPDKEGGYAVQKKINAPTFAVGSGNQSITLFPEHATAKDGTVYIDLPGLQDTRGSGSAFLNAVCIHNILTQARSVKFIFVESEGSFTGTRSIFFEKLLNTIMEMLPNPTLLQKSSLLVITKNFKEEVIKEIIIPHAKQEFYQIFPQETLKKKLILFCDPENFKDNRREESSDTENEDEENKKKQFNDKRFNHHKKKLKKRVQKKLAEVQGLSISSINFSALIPKEIPQQLKEICGKTIKKWIANYENNIQLAKFDIEELKACKDTEKLKNVLHNLIQELKKLSNINFELKKFIQKTELFSFVETFDKKLFLEIFLENKECLEDKVKHISHELNIKIEQLKSIKADKETMEKFEKIRKEMEEKAQKDTKEKEKKYKEMVQEIKENHQKEKDAIDEKYKNMIKSIHKKQEDRNKEILKKQEDRNKAQEERNRKSQKKMRQEQEDKHKEMLKKQKDIYKEMLKKNKEQLSEAVREQEWRSIQQLQISNTIKKNKETDTLIIRSKKGKAYIEDLKTKYFEKYNIPTKKIYYKNFSSREDCTIF